MEKCLMGVLQIVPKCEVEDLATIITDPSPK